MKRFFSDATFTASSQLFSALSTLGIQVYVARSVSLGEYGQYAATQAYVLLIEAIFVARGGEVALQYLGKYWRVNYPYALWYRRHLVRLDVRMNIAIYAVTVLLGYFLGSILNFKWEWVVLLALTIPAQIGYGASKSVFIVDGKLKQMAYLEIGYSILLVVMTLAATALLGIVGLLFAMVLASLFKTVVTHQITRRYWPINVHSDSPAPLPNENADLFRSANVHSVVRNAIMNGAAQGDVLLMNALRGPEAAALYKVAKMIAAMPVRVIAPAWVALRPRIMDCVRSKNINRLHRLLLLPAGVLAVVGGLIAWPLAQYGDTLMVLGFGNAYAAAATPALWLMLGTWIFGAISGWLNFACVISSHKAAGTIIYSIWFVGVLLGGFLWGQSATSMAIVAALSMTTAAFAGWYYFMRTGAWVNEIKVKTES